MWRPRISLQGEHHEEAYDDADDFGSRADGAEFQRSSNLDEFVIDDPGEKAPQESQGRCTEFEFDAHHFEQHDQQASHQISGLRTRRSAELKAAVMLGLAQNRPSFSFRLAKSSSGPEDFAQRRLMI